MENLRKLKCVPIKSLLIRLWNSILNHIEAQNFKKYLNRTPSFLKHFKENFLQESKNFGKVL